MGSDQVTRVESSGNGISALLQMRPQRAPSSLGPVRTQQDIAVPEPGSRLQTPKLASTMSLDFLPPELWENVCCLQATQSAGFLEQPNKLRQYLNPNFTLIPLCTLFYLFSVPVTPVHTAHMPGGCSPPVIGPEAPGIHCLQDALEGRGKREHGKP